MTIDIDAIREKWATVCGPCDGGLPQGCTCPTGDPRVPISALITEVSEVTAERDLSYDLLDGAAKALGLGLDNYHVHNEVPAKAAELVVERDQFRESARYYSALVGELTADRDAARTERLRHAADADRLAREVDALTAALAAKDAALTEANRKRTVAEAAHEALLRDNRAYAAQVAQLKREVADLGMFKTRYFEVQELLDKVLGPDEEDGTGEGIVQEVALVAEQRDVARAEADALRPHADGAEVRDAAGTEWFLDGDLWMVNHPGGERLTWAELDRAYGPLTAAEVAS